MRIKTSQSQQPRAASLYTPQERARRDATIWTFVQGALAPIQFLAFIISVGLIARYLVTGNGLFAAEISIIVKTMLLYAIMITGSIWEKVVFGHYLFARPFFWEDVVSMLVLALHTAYLWCYWTAALGAEALMTLALVAYVTYVVNAAQFLWKLRMARLEGASPVASAPSAMLEAAQ